MPIWLQIILVLACIGLALKNFGLSQDLKQAEEFLKMYKNTNERLNSKLKKANEQIAELKAANGESKPKTTKIPSFLLADDPMDALFRSVGRLDE